MMKPRAGDRRRGPLLTDVLSLALPTPTQTRLLQALLLDGEPGAAAFRAWQARVGDARLALGSDTHGLKQMLALLYAALRGQRAALDAALATYLRIAYTRERLRGEQYWRIGARIVAALARADIPALIVGEAAAALMYEDPLLRHAGTFDLLLDAADLPRAAALLAADGCAPSTSAGRRTVLRHVSGLPVVLDTALFDLPYYAAASRDLWSAALPTTVAGVPARVPSADDLLLLLCAPGSPMHTCRPPWWVCDAWHIIHRAPDPEWSTLPARARSAHLCLPLLVALRYLRSRFGAPIPATVLEQVAMLASGTTAHGYEAALWTLRRSTPALGRRQMLHRAVNWRSRTVLLKWLLLPSMAHLDSPFPEPD